MAGDFVLLNLIIQLIANIYWRVDSWPERSLEIFILVNNLALLIAQLRFSTIIHLRLIGAGDLLQRMVLNDNKQSINGGGSQ
jgi:putative colanic acid biosynthesis UDP-glucose lipid carrier transferase